VLQRIALCYFFASLISLAGIKARGQAVIALVLLVGYHLLMKHVSVPGYGPGNLNRTGNLASYIDAKVLGAHSYTYIKEFNTWHDPEGILSTIPAIATALIGTITGFWLRDRTRGGYEKASGMMAAGLAMMVVGWLWSYLFPFNKNLWSPSYVMYAGGWALGGLGTCLFLTDMKRILWWTKPFLIMGTNSIAIYVTVGIVSILSVTRFPLGAAKTFRAKDWAYDHLVASWAVPLFGNSVSSLLYGILYIAIFTIIFSWFYKRRIFFRV
jgi:predicted acyltransferase